MMRRKHDNFYIGDLRFVHETSDLFMRSQSTLLSINQSFHNTQRWRIR